MLTLLLLSGGGHTGTNVMFSLLPWREGLRLVATSDVPDEPALFGFDAVYLAPNLAGDPAGFSRRLLEIIDRECPDLVVPCRDEDVEWLSALRERRPELAPRLLCGSHAVAALANDKWRSHEFARAHRLPFAPTLACGAGPEARLQVEAFAAAHGLPLIVKPRRESDSRGITLVSTLAQARRAMQREDHVLQAYLGDPAAVTAWLSDVEERGIPLFHSFQGAKRSIQILIGPHGDVVHLLCTRNVVSGRNARTISVDDDPAAAAIGARCAQVFSEEGWRGPLNVQCQLDQAGMLAIHEFNARFTGATGARSLLGCDEVGAAVHAFTGRAVPRRAAPGQPPRVAREGLWPRAADAGAVRDLAERGTWTHGT